MKKIIAIAAAIALVATFGAGMAFASSNGSNGVPAQKATASWVNVDYTPISGHWVPDNRIGAISIHTPNNSANSLIISYTGEAALMTDVKLSGSTGSSSSAGLMVRAVIDKGTASQIIAKPGAVDLTYRMMTLTGTLWEPTDNTTLFGTLPTQYIDIYEATRSANGFNFVVPDVGGGTHTVTIEYSVNTTYSGLSTKASEGVAIGKRTVLVEDDNLN